jgi:NAD(P)-dependent dehydrogenase (short-subunit alcohol dehydrogenase family)
MSEQLLEKREDTSVQDRLRGKVALVTGGGRGLGEAICRSLASAGVSTIVADVRADLAQHVAAEIRADGHDTIALHLDVGDDQAAQKTIDEATAIYGRVDFLINNAGVDLTVSIEEMSIEDWDRILGVNLRGPFVMAKSVFPLMREQGDGHIVNIVSTAAKRAWANASAYHASKWGLLGLSHALHVEGRAHGIKVTAVVSGGMRTPFLLDRFPDLDPGVLQDPKNVAETVRFVLSQPQETVIPEVMVLPMKETSWP